MISSGMWSIQVAGPITGQHDYSVKNDETTILVVGDADEAATLFGRRETTGIRFSRCAEGNDMATSLCQPGRRYDWILVDAALFDGDEKDFIQSLRVTGSFISGRNCREGRSCGVEWLADGSLQMNCCMRTPMRKSCFSSQRGPAEGDSVVFEYQAPVKRAK